MEEERKVVVLNIDDILPNRFQPRIKFNENAINELAESIKLHGVIQPIVVRKISDKYEIIAGERRYKASIIAGKTTIPAIVTSLDDKNSAEVALIENVQRQDLTPIEEAISYKKILDMGYINQEELGAKLGKKQSTIANKLRLLNLNDEVQEALMENKISERHARSLLRLNEKNQILMLNRIINERLTVRKTDEEINKLLDNNDVGAEKVIEMKKEEKGDINMNNDILRDFNIPTEPIVNNNDSEDIVFDDNENIQPVSPIDSQPISNVEPQPITNPGFMDIDKIQSVAQDIVKEPEPVADMGELLKPDENEPKQDIQVEQPFVQPTVQQGGKFFNMFNFNEPEENPNYVENIESKQVNMDFNEPIVDKSFNPFDETPINQDSTPSLFNQNIVENNEQSENIQPVSPIDSQPISNVESQPVQVEASNISVDNSNISATSTNPFSEIVQPMSLTDDNDFKSIEPISSQPISNVESTSVQSVEPQPVASTIQRPYMMSDDVKFDEEGEIEVKLPEQNIKRVSVDIKTVINTIRDCAATIEKYGYKIETDELDLADSYEVTFRIEKNN